MYRIHRVIAGGRGDLRHHRAAGAYELSIIFECSQSNGAVGMAFLHWNFETDNFARIVRNGSTGNYTEARDGVHPAAVGDYQGQVIITGEISFLPVD